MNHRTWILLAATGLLACSADAGSGNDVGDDDSGSADGSSDASTHDASNPDGGHVDASTPDASVIDSSMPDTSSSDTSTADSNAIDTGTTDASDGGADAAPDAPVEAAVEAGLPPVGSPCATPNSTQQQRCGLCGEQNRVCLSVDGGQAVWQDWGFCQNEVAGGCVPGTMSSQACGLCGTRQVVCQNDCTYATGACTGQPMNACTPGTIDFELGLSCDAGGRSRTCQADCTFGNFGSCTTQTTTGGLTIGAVGATVTGTFTLAPTPQIARMSTGTCPKTSAPSGTATSYSYVTVTNPTSASHTVSIWNSAATGGANIDTVMTVYNGSTPPATPTDREACLPYVNDTCNTGPCVPNQYLWAGLVLGGDGPVTIPANATVTVYTASYYSTDSGNYALSAKTEN